MRRVCCCLVLLFACFGSAHAQSLVDGSLTGIVSNAEGAVQGGVQVKVFVDGFARGNAVTGPDGAYSVAYPYDRAADQTVVIWYLPQAGYVPEVVVLRESARAAAIGLWSPCIARIPLAPSITHDAIVHTESEKFDALSKTGCL